MDNAITIRRLRELGLTDHESRSYLSLLKKDVLTVSEISRLAGIPRANTYEALEKLLDKGLCISKPGKVKKYSAAGPSSLEEKVLPEFDNKAEIEMQALLTKRKAIHENVGILVKELTPLYRNSRNEDTPLDYIEIMKNPHQIHKRFIELVGKAKEEILAFVRPPYSGPRKKLEEQNEQQTTLLRGGLIIKAIYEIPRDKEEMEWRYKIIDRMSKRGEESRVSKSLPMKMFVFDEKIAMYALEDPISGETFLTMQVVEHRALAKSLKMLFYHIWEQAEDYHILKDLLKKM